MNSDIKHNSVSANGIRLHVAEQGQGPLMLLCHGWPELWYSWKHQLSALAAARFRAVAPDMRGYGQSEAPADVHAYSILNLVGDMVALVASLGEREAIIVGHDWGANVAWNAAMLRPDIFRAVAALSVPFRARGPMPPLQALRQAGHGTSIGSTSRHLVSPKPSSSVMSLPPFDASCTRARGMHHAGTAGSWQWRAEVVFSTRPSSRNTFPPGCPKRISYSSSANTSALAFALA